MVVGRTSPPSVLVQQRKEMSWTSEKNSRRLVLVVAMEYRCERATVITLCHNMAVSDTLLFLSYFHVHLFSGAQCVGESRQTNSCATDRPCPSMFSREKCLSEIMSIFH